MFRYFTSILLLLFPTAIVAAGQPAKKIDEIVRWNFDNSANGWKAMNQCSLSSADGVLTVDFIGKNPYLSAAVKAPSGWKELSFRAKVNGRAIGQIVWTTTKDKHTSERNIETRCTCATGVTASFTPFTWNLVVHRMLPRPNALSRPRRSQRRTSWPIRTMVHCISPLAAGEPGREYDDHTPRQTSI